LPALKESSLVNLRVGNNSPFNPIVGNVFSEILQPLLKSLEFDTRIFGFGEISTAINKYLAHKMVYLANMVKKSEILSSGVDDIVVEYLVKDAESFKANEGIDVTPESLHALRKSVESFSALRGEAKSFLENDSKSYSG